jgi:hypothetical protein
MGSRLGNQVESIETFADAEGQPVYYIVYLRPSGFVIVSAEDGVEPVIGFVSEGTFDPSPQNPLGALVSRDLPGRVKAARTVQEKMRSGRTATAFTEREAAVRDSAQKAVGKWRKLLAYDDNTPVEATWLTGVSDVRVAPLVETKWGQKNCCSSPALACFNYYTPPYTAGSTSNYYCGCVATAMAQYMRFWQYPTTGVGTPCFTNELDETRCLRGGDGSGGPYHWTDMVLDPDCYTTVTQREAIGALTYDAGVAAKMMYSSGGSGAYPDDAAAAMVYPFGYSNSICGWNGNNNLGTALNAMVNPNLDWGNPVILSILYGDPQYPDRAHAIVTDGYGYDASTLYHHLNMGWDGYYDAWYNLPNIDCPSPYNSVYAANYNIYTTGTGEIISGRVTEAGTTSPIADANVTAVRAGGGTYTATTNSKGIYVFAKVPSNSTYTVSVSKNGYSFTNPRVTSTGRSEDMEPVSGNRWGIDFTGTSSGPVPPVASNSDVSVEPGMDVQITLLASDDGQPNPPGALSYIVTSRPVHGRLSDPLGGEIHIVPYTLAGDGNDVIYMARVCYAGSDSFQFKANDGGSPPEGGDSNIATVGITIESPAGGEPEVIYETHFDTGLPAGWTIIHGGETSETWKSTNPYGYTSPYWTGVFMLVDGSVEYGSMDEQLITHGIDCTNLTDIKLRFKYDFVVYWSEEIGDVDIRVNGGTWQNVARYQGANYSGLVELNLSSFGIEGHPNVQIRWRYYNTGWGWYWGIDDVSIIATPAAEPALEPPVGDFEPDCDVDHDDLYILADAWLTSSGQGNWNGDCDIAEPNDGIINECDFAVFAQNWLTSVE